VRNLQQLFERVDRLVRLPGHDVESCASPPTGVRPRRRLSTATAASGRGATISYEPSLVPAGSAKVGETLLEDWRVLEPVDSRSLRIHPRRRSPTALRRDAEGESPRTIVIALLANVVIGVAKLIAGLVSGSSAMIAEAAHSGADSVNEIFLALGLYRARRPADELHPFGYARERFLWAFMAAIGSFLIGGCLSIALAVRELEARRPVAGAHLAPWIVLAVSFAADGTSWLQGLRQARRQAKDYGLSVWRYINRASDPVVRAVLLEDSAALIGLVIAAGGLLLTHITGSSVPDSLASLLIGVLLACTAFALARPFADFLVGRSIPTYELEALRAIFEADPTFELVLTIQAFYLAPEEVVVLAKARPARGLNSGELSQAMDELDRRVREKLPFVAEVYVDVTASTRPTNAT
jgi:cation diffusion facilitator family transporter